MKGKRTSVLAAVLVCGMCLGAVSPAALAAEGMENFQTSEVYQAGLFTDVAAGAWYAQSVETAYELGLVKGSGVGTFSPEGSITVGSALALACRLHSIYYTGSGTFQQGSPWYQVYVDYAIRNGIITQGQFSDYNANATRQEFACILAHALPESVLGEINQVPDNSIPDVSVGANGWEEIYRLYRAGVLTGSDSAGTFAPGSTIDRASVAAIVSRMAVPSLRVTVQQPAQQPDETPVPTLSEADRNAVMGYVADALEYVHQGQQGYGEYTMDQYDFMGDRLAVLNVKNAANCGGLAALSLDSALEILDLQDAIPITESGYTSLQELTHAAREEVWQVMLDCEDITESDWVLHLVEGNKAMASAEGKLQTIQQILSEL